MKPMTKTNGALVEEVVNNYITRFAMDSKAARMFSRGLEPLGLNLRTLVDLITVRTLDVDKRAKEFLDLGFEWDQELGVLEFDNWWAKVYRRPAFPAVFIDQAYEGERGKGSLIPAWVDKFGDRVLHHVAVMVGDIERAIADLKSKGIECVGEIVGSRGGPLRQIFTAPEVKDGQPYTVLELTERHAGYLGFMPPQADSLMKSTALQKAS